MLDSEPNDRELHDHATGGRGAGAGELSAGPSGIQPSVPAALFQPPPVVFQPPPPPTAWEPSPASPPPASARSAGASSAARAEGAGEQRTPADSAAFEDAAEDGTAAGRRRRRRPSRSRARTGDQDAAGEGDDAAPSGQGAQAAQEPEGATDQPVAQRPATRSRSRRASAAKGPDPKTGVSAPGSQGTAGSAVTGSPAEGDEADSADHSDGEAGVARRRRRKRRRGSAEGASDSITPDDPPDTVVHVREPNGPAGPAGGDDVRAVRGSTRLEAKKQRRREGRDTGRRRPPVLTESEYLARRESVERTMVVRQRKDRTQIAVLEDGVLVEHYVNRSSQQSYVGNVYLGKVQNVLPSMEAAFVDIGKGRNAVLYAGEVNFDLSGLEGQPKRIESALKAGQSVIVQVTKDPMGHKGARLTSQISLPGRYLVYVPGSSMTGISRKLPDVERNRLKQILKQVMPENGGVIVRTAAEGAAEDELSRDVSRLAAQWEAIEKKSKTASAPALLYSEPDLTIRVIRDVFNEDFSSLVVSGDEGWDVVDEYVRYVAPHLADRLTRWQEDRDVFGVYRIDEQLAKALERKVWLPSGGSLVIDKTEAMTVIDVNTGKFTGQGGNLEETVTRNNLEAAEEIVRQLRLRDVGGIVVIDFIDMVLESNRELVLRRLLECLGRDRTKHQVAEVTSLGLVQMTRKRVGAGLLEAFSQPCECCNGRGVIITYDPEADAQAAHHVHARGVGNGGQGNGSRTSSAPASPAAIAARTRPSDAQPAMDGPEPDGPRGTAHPDSAAVAAEPATAAQAPNGRGEPGRSAGNGRRRRRRPSAAAAAASAAAASAPAVASAPAASEAPAAPEAPSVARPEPEQARDGAA